jgi:heavy metal sensor kinase
MKKTRIFRSLSFQLTLWYIIFLGITIVLAGAFLHKGFKDRLVNDLDKTVLEVADDTYEEWREERGVGWKEAFARSEEHFSTYSPILMLVEIAEEGKQRIAGTIYPDRYADGIYLFETDLYYRADRSDIEALVYATVKDKRLGSYPVRMILYPVRGPYILQVGISLENTSRQLKQLLLTMILAGGLLLIVASAGGSFIINRALHPVKSVVKTAKNISADDLSLRINVKNRGDEIGALIETFNDMIIRLEKSVTRIRQFSGDVSHELRTPLTIIRGEVEVLLRKSRTKEEYTATLDSVLEESQRMEKIINDLLFLSRVEGMERSRLKDMVQLEEIISDVLESRETAVKRKRLHLTVESGDSHLIEGNRELLERMLANLVDNSVRYTPEGGHINISLAKEGETIKLAVSDTGIGIPEESLPKIFDRFFVVDKSRSKETGGSGLGLSIVKWIAESHGARIAVSSRLGQGTSFVLYFPAV